MTKTFKMVRRFSPQGERYCNDQVCSQHASIVAAQNKASESYLSLSKDIGKVSERTARVEEHVKEIPALITAVGKMSDSVTSLNESKTHSKAFVGGVVATISVIVLGAYYLGSIAQNLWTVLKQGNPIPPH